MSHEILDNILDDKIESSDTEQINLFDNNLDDEPSTTQKISATAGKVFDDVMNAKESWFPPAGLTTDEKHLLTETPEVAYETPSFTSSKPEPALNHEAEFIKYVEEHHKGYDNFYTPILKRQAEFIKDQQLHNNENPAITKLTLSVLPTLLDKLTIKDLIGIQPMNGPCSMIYALENKYKDDGTMLSLDAHGYAVEAGTRKLQMSITDELMLDLNMLNGMYTEAELMSAVSSEVANELNGEFLNDIRDVAHCQTASLDYENQLLNRINTASTMIAQRSRRGFGNWIVVNPTMLARIQLAADSTDKELRERNDDYKDITFKQTMDKIQIDRLSHVGTYRDQIEVYCDLYSNDDNDVLVGYNGGKHQTDTGMIYAPYVLLMSRGMVINPETFQPLNTFMTRYGKWVSSRAEDYYTKLTIE